MENIPEVTIRELSPMRLVGRARDFISVLAGPLSDAHLVIPQLWNEVSQELAEHPQLHGGWAVGAVGPAENAWAQPGTFAYFAGMDAPVEAERPAGFEELNIPGGWYAVCEHTGGLATIGETTTWFLTTWLAESGVRPRMSHQLEIYDERWLGDVPESVVVLALAIEPPTN